MQAEWSGSKMWAEQNSVYTAFKEGQAQINQEAVAREAGRKSLEE